MAPAERLTDYDILETIRQKRQEEERREQSVLEAKQHIPHLRNRLERIAKRTKYDPSFSNRNHSDKLPDDTGPIPFTVIRFGSDETLKTMPFLVSYAIEAKGHPDWLTIQGLSSASIYIGDPLKGKKVRDMEMRDYRAFSEVITEIEKMYHLEPLEETPLPTPTPQTIPVL